MTKRLFLGIDVSTTGAKALLIDEKGAVVATATTPLTLSTPKPLWSEQDPHEWWSGTAKSIRKVLATAQAKGGRRGRHRPHRPDARAGAAGCRPQGAASGHPLERPAHRRASATRSGRAWAAATPLVRVTGNDALTGFTAPKILWVRNHEPEVYAQGAPRPAAQGLRAPAAHRASPPWTRPTARAPCSSTWPRATGRRRCWPSSTFRAAWLPPTFEGPEVTGEITDEAAADTGLARGNAGHGGRRRPGGGGGGRGRGGARASWR